MNTPSIETAEQIAAWRTVTDAAIAEWGPGRVGVRLSPFNPFNDIADADPFTTFPMAASLLDKLPLAYLHVTYGGGSPADRARIAPLLLDAFHGPLMVHGGYTAQSAEEALEAEQAEQAEAVAFGVPFLANPDLPARFEGGAELNAPDPATFYNGHRSGLHGLSGVEQHAGVRCSPFAVYSVHPARYTGSMYSFGTSVSTRPVGSSSIIRPVRTARQP